MQRYNPSEIEPRWQKIWEESKIYQATEDPNRPKRYVLEYFPYPSGSAMHVGHVRNYTIGDAIARYYRMQGYSVMHPMGWDAFGLPAENYAIKNNISPKQAIAENTGKFKKQLMQMGFSYDWSREINSSDPKYYKWTQWFFKLLFDRGLAYQKESLQWWCDTDKTVLANEQVEAGKCWRCGNPVTKKPLKQWFFKITDYADRLVEDLDKLDWSDAIKSMQCNWIGKSKGAEVEFVVGESATPKDTLKFTPELTDMINAGQKWSTIRLEPKKLQVGDITKLQTRFSADKVQSFALAKIKSVATQKLKDIPLDLEGHEKYANQDQKLADYQKYYGNQVTLETEFTIYEFEKTADIITVFTTRPDTLFGATFMVLAPEHPIVDKITTLDQKAKVEEYVKQTQAKSDVERQETDREKSGVFTGAYAVNPVNNEQIPIWIADYVLYGYGTGAIMAVPAHDERDNAFAKKFDLPIKDVIAPYFPASPSNEMVDGIPIVRRRNVVVALKHWSENKYLCLDWHVREDWRSFIIGGIKDAETVEEAAIREAREETGFKNIVIDKVIPGEYHSKFYAAHKGINRHMVAYQVIAHIENDEKVPIQEIDTENHDTVWVDSKNLVDFMGFSNHKHTARIVLGEEPSMTTEGIMINSGEYNDLETNEAREKIVADLSMAGEPREYFDEQSPLKKGQPIVERTAVQAIVRQPGEDKYLLLKLMAWKNETYSLPMGGIKDGENVIGAALREVREETGFVDCGEVREMAPPYFANFYHEGKKENRRAKIHTIFIQLNSLKQDEIDEAEKKLHEPRWVSLDDLLVKVSGEGAKEVIRGFRDGGFVANGPARVVTNYKIRDWLISRQRYWGAPIPVVHCEKDGAVAVPEDQLPVELPEVESYQPTGEGTSVLSSVHDWVNTTCPKCGGPAKRETDTMDGFACSSWYFLRFADPHNADKPFDPEKVKFWLPVDDYIGGAEHAVMHLLYARMWTKVAFDAGLIEFDEPFSALRNHGMILAPDGRKMSKSWGNVIAPDEIIDQGYGADAIRIMELFIGPWNQSANWSVEGMGGCFRFLQRIWILVQEFQSGQEASNEAEETKILRLTNKTIKKVTDDLERMGFNTAIASLMEFVNDLYKIKTVLPASGKNQAWAKAITALTQLVAPFAPHIADEIWQQLGREKSVHISAWPEWDNKYLVEETMQIVVQVNGKLRANIEVPADCAEADVKAAALGNEKVKEFVKGEIKKVIYVSGRLINIVA